MIQDEQMIVRSGASMMMPVVTIAQAVDRYNAVVEFTKRILQPGRDYGVIPGTERIVDGVPSNHNSTLLKPGAEKLCTFFGLVAKFIDYRVIEDWDKGLFYFAYRCELYRDERLVATGIGSANSREKKYRRQSRTCPQCFRPCIKKSRYAPKGSPRGAPGGWYCDAKSGGCGAEYSADDPQVLEQERSNDPDAAADQINTLQKMAQKRSLVAATLLATNASEFFTQDLDDLQYIDGQIVEDPAVSTEVRPGPNGRHVADDHANGQHETSESPEPPSGPDLARDDVFLSEWQRLMSGRGFSMENAQMILDAGLKKRDRKLSDIPVHARREMLKRVESGAYDGQKIVAASQTVPPSMPDGAPPSPWEQFIRDAIAYAARKGINETAARSAISKVVKASGKRQSHLSTNQLIQWLSAMEENRFDWSAGTVMCSETP